MQQNDNILKDTDRNGKDRKWRARKIASQNLAEAYRDVWINDLIEEGWTPDEIDQFIPREYRFGYFNRSEKTDRCADILTFVRTEEGRLKLYQAWFCRDRLCNMCNWCRSMKFAVQVSELLKTMQDRGIKAKPIFATFTLRNVPGDEISKAISHFSLSFQRIMKYKRCKAYCIGTIRTTEITYSADADTWHVHIHCLIWMTPGYFRHGYITQKEWRALWAKAARIDYDPWVDVKTVKPRKPTENDPTGMYKAVLEVCKYPIKPDAYTALTDPPEGETPEAKEDRLRRIRQLRDGLAHKRLISFSGVLKQLRAELQLDDPEDGDLIQTGEDQEDQSPVVDVVVAQWDRTRRNYYTHDEQMKREHMVDWHTEKGVRS